MSLTSLLSEHLKYCHNISTLLGKDLTSQARKGNSYLWWNLNNLWLSCSGKNTSLDYRPDLTSFSLEGPHLYARKGWVPEWYYKMAVFGKTNNRPRGTAASMTVLSRTNWPGISSIHFRHARVGLSSPNRRLQISSIIYLLANSFLKKKDITNIREVARLYNVLWTTLRRQLNGNINRAEKQANGLKLTNGEEESLIQ